MTITKESKFRDNTMVSCYKMCPREYFIRHILGWCPDVVAAPLAFGLSWHNGQDAIWQYAKKAPQDQLVMLAMAKFLETWEEEGFPADMDIEQLEKYAPRTPPVAHEMINNYIQQRWNMLQEAELIAVEQPFAVPLPGTDDIWYVGRLDKVVRYQGQIIPLEHKTTTEYKKDGGFTSNYVEGWFSDSQIKGYQFGGGLFFPGAAQVWVDAALVHKQVHDKFRFIPIAHSMPLLQEWIDDTREWIARAEKDTAAFAKDGELRPGVFPKNESQCFRKFGRCQFLDICRSTADPTKLGGVPQGFKLERWSPFETLKLDKLIQNEKPATTQA